MTTTTMSLLPRDASASAWRIPPRRLQGGSNDAYDMGGPLPICWYVYLGDGMTREEGHALSYHSQRKSINSIHV